jgi:uncharacterized membrane protein YsdA (DUF1294 family)
VEGLLAWLAAANLCGIVAIPWDKWQARRSGPSIPEAALHALALCGGWPAMALGFVIVRHKTRKKGFLAVFLLAAVANVALIALWMQT